MPYLTKNMVYLTKTIKLGSETIEFTTWIFLWVPNSIFVGNFRFLVFIGTHFSIKSNAWGGGYFVSFFGVTKSIFGE